MTENVKDTDTSVLPKVGELGLNKDVNTGGGKFGISRR